MKLIIDVAEKYYEACKDAVEKPYPSQIEEVIANGTPYNPSGDSISRSTLRKAFKNHPLCNDVRLQYSREINDSVPPVTQGECKSCRHRDPEDKKCDCGAKERQGCPFPVSDDYFCKFYEKGGDNA